MRAPFKTTALLALMVLVSFSGVAAQYFEPAVFVNMDEVTGLTPAYEIPVGGVDELIVPVRFINIDDARTAISNGYDFTPSGAAGFSGLLAEWNPNYPWDWPHAIALGIFPPYFDQGLFINYFTNGAGFAGLTGGSGSGLPADFAGIAYNFTLSDVTGDPGDVITMDSTWWLPANYWLWSGVAENVYWGGPYDFVFETPVPTPPTITSAAVTSATIFQLYSYDVQASGYPTPTYALTTAPTGMTINSTTGLIQWTPDAMATGVPVVVEATNSEGTDVQSFAIDVGGIVPTFTSTPVTSGNVDEPYTYDADADGYPTPTYALTTFPTGMTIDAVTGVITWTPDAEGSFAVVVEASNSEGTTPQSFSIEVGPAFEPPVITSYPVTAAAVGSPYSYDVDASGYLPPTYALTVFPSGMTIDANSGIISWTPGATGDYSVTVEATNASGTDAQSFTVTVYSGGTSPSIVSTPVTTANVGQLYTYDVDADGYPAPTYTLSVNPAGMTIDAVSGIIQWTPSATGDYDVEVTAANGNKPDAKQSFTITVSDAGTPPVITSTPVTTGTYGVLYSYDVEATGTPAPTFALTTFPSGMTINPTTGLISWTPGDVGDFDVVVEANNSAGTDVQSFTITVGGVAPSFTSTPITTGTYGVAYSYDADASGYPAPTFALTTFPTGMTINTTTGLISWTPGDVGDFDVVVEATNSAGTDVQSFTITVGGVAPTFTSTPVTTGTYGVAYSYDANADGYPTPTYALTTFPTGMTIDAVTGVISWTPGDVGDFDVVVEASNSAGTTPQSFTITVGGIAPSFTSSPVTTGTYGVAYSYDADADGYPAPTYALTTFPTGMTIDAASGVISWTPDDVGDFDVVVEASNSAGTTPQSFTITVAGIAPSFTSTPVTTGTYGVAYSYDANADGYPAPTFALTTFPTGMTIDGVSGVISWTPGDIGDFDVVVEATNSEGTDVQSFTITVAGVAPSFTSTPITTGTYGVAYSYDADADGYPTPTYALTTFPTGMTIDAASGVISWTPDDVGDFDVVVEASNSAGTTPQSFTITVEGIAPSFTSTPVTTGTYGVAYSYDADADGYPTPTYALTTFPTGMTIDAVSGVISWTPGDVGDFDVVVEASNSAGTTPQSFTITVAGIAPSFTSTPVTTGTYGVAYTYDADADGYPAPTFALTTFPTGMTIDANTGEISWIPGDVGDFDVVVEASNSAGTDYQSFTITVEGIAPSFTSSPVTTGTYGVAYSYDADADGYPTPTFALTTFPTGMTIDANTGVISWIPDDDGDFDVVVEASNSAGTDVQSFTIAVEGIAPSFTSTPVTTGTYGVAYSYDADADGYPAPTFALTAAPSGMTIDAVTGVISWTPDDVGDFGVVVQATNAYGTDLQAFTISVAGIAPSFTSTPVTTGTYGVAYSYDADADGYPAPTFALTTFPAGMTIDAVTGVISWTPGDVGDFDVVVEASNVAGTTPQSFTITVEGIAPSFTSTPVTTGTYGVAYSYDADADGYPAPTFALTTFPTGMTIDAVSGVISWTPGDVGDFDVVVEASNSAGTDVQSFTITVAGVAPSFTSSPVTTGTYGVAYSYDADADGYPAPTFALTTFPTGMTIDAVSGVISWTPGDVGDFDVVVEASNSAGTDVQSFTITVGGVAPSFTSTPVTTGTYGVAYSYDADADGYPAPTFSLTTFPTGMTIDAVSGVISWTPGDVGDFDVVVEASNSAGTDVQSFTITVVGVAPSFTSTPVTTGTYGVAYSYDADADGYPAPTFALTTFPTGMTIDANTGEISWIPGDVGDFDVVVEASNSAGSDVQSFTITVAGVAPMLADIPDQMRLLSETFTYDADASGYPAPTYSLTTFPTGMTIDANTGVINWTPTGVGDYYVVVEATNSAGTDTEDFTLSIVADPVAPVITSTPVTTGTYNVAYSYDVDATGNPVPTYALTTFPTGMTIDAVTGVISWTPGDVGDFDVVVEANNSAGTDVQAFTITVGGIAPSFTSTPVTTGTYGVAYSYDADADGYPAPTFALTTFPTGMTIDGLTGVISWTPGDVGDFDVVVEASNSAGTDVQSFTITVGGIAPSFTSTPVTTGTYGVAYSYDADADGYPAPTFALTTFPTGMTIDANTGVISWTPGDVGDFDVVVEASNSAGSDVQSFTITVAGVAPMLADIPDQVRLLSETFTYDADASGYPDPTYSLTTFPTGMTIDGATGVINWTPTGVGDFNVVVEATNSAGTDTEDFLLTILPDLAAPVITSTPVTTGTYGVAYSYDVDATGNPVPTYALTTFPTGMTIDAATGLISWTPGDVGDFDVVVEATNSEGTDVQSYTITVGGIAPSFTSTPVTTGTYGVAYSYDANADGYPAPTYGLTTFPAGMTIDAVTGVVSWTPGDVGDFDVVIEATNSAGTTPQSFTITVGGVAPSFTSTPVTTGSVGIAYSYDADADGYPAPTFALTTFPTGMTIDAATGMVSWTPGAIGDYAVVIEASNSAGTDVQSFMISVDYAPAAPSITSTAVTTGRVNVLYVYNVDADGYPVPTFSLTTFPTGMTIDAISGLIEWTPTAAGDFDVVVEATNDYGTDAQSFTISVTAEAFTTCWPQPSILKDLENDRILNVAIHNEVIDDVVFESILVQGKIPPYTPEAPYIDGDSIVTDCFIMRFLGSSGFRPIPPEGVHEKYTVEYDKVGGEHVILTGDFNLNVSVGDVNLDGVTNIQDVQFMTDYFWLSGRNCEIEEFMDVDWNGKVNINDIRTLIEMLGL